MKIAILITMILAVMTPVLAQGTKYNLYECRGCGQQKQVKDGYGSPSPFDGQCIDKHTGKRRSSHSWQKQ